MGRNLGVSENYWSYGGGVQKMCNKDTFLTIDPSPPQILNEHSLRVLSFWQVYHKEYTLYTILFHLGKHIYDIYFRMTRLICWLYLPLDVCLSWQNKAMLISTLILNYMNALISYTCKMCLFSTGRRMWDWLHWPSTFQLEIVGSSPLNLITLWLFLQTEIHRSCEVNEKWDIVKSLPSQTVPDPFRQKGEAIMQNASHELASQKMWVSESGHITHIE